MNVPAMPQSTPGVALVQLLLKPLEGSRIQYSNHLEGDPARLYERLCELGAEGIVSKVANAPYHGGRDPSWLKIKCRGRAAEHAKRSRSGTS
jgi:bifunctional non-homologous end joining protein LigD